MSVSLYGALLDKCEPSSPEYAVLMKGIIVHRRENGHYKRWIQIACEVDEANVLFTTATQLYPDAAAPIAYAISKACDS
jgi:hypothetical protein